MQKIYFFTIVLTNCFLSEIAFGQSNESVSAISIKRIKENATPPKIDGLFETDEWKDAVTTSLKFQYEPQENATASEKTEVYLLFDKEFLYLAFRAFDSEPSLIRAPVSKRDNIGQDDFVSIWLDTFDDRRRTYVFRFNPLGIQEDGVFTESETGNLAWDGILESKGSINKEGYVVEAKIPFRTLRFQINENKTWGLHLLRSIPRKQEDVSWQPISRNKVFFAQMGSLSGIDDIFGKRTLDIIPTVTLSNNGTREPDATSPNGGRLNNVNKADFGLTASYSITPNLTLSATINPDFSQVEADVPQISVNQRFPLSFAEKRPFFLEGAEIFRSSYAPAPRLVDTRQIVDPDWGIKLTGKIGKNTIGLLSVSDRAPGLRISPTNINFGKNALFNIGRYSRDILKQSNIGFFFTDRRFANSSNTVGALDGRSRIGDKHLLAYILAYSQTTELNGTKRSGASAYFAYQYNSRTWNVTLTDSHFARNFRAQAGFIRRTGYDRQFINVARTFRPKEKSWWINFRPHAIGTILQNENGNLDESSFEAGAGITLAKNISLFASYSRYRNNFLGRVYDTQSTEIEYFSETFKKVMLEGEIEFGTGVNFDPSRPEIGNIFNVDLSVNYKPISQLNSEFLWLKSSLKSRLNDQILSKQDILRNRTVFQFNRFHAVRSIIDYDTSERRIGVSFLYGFTPRPNTAFFVGYSDLLYNGFDPLTDKRTSGLFRQSRTIFAKVSYNFRF